MDMNYLDIPEYAKLLSIIPFGEENAIKRPTLVRLLGVNDRTNRDMISNLRTCAVILHSPKGGYYRPTDQEADKVRRYIKQERSRAISNFRSVQFAERYLEDIKRGVLDGTHKIGP